MNKTQLALALALICFVLALNAIGISRAADPPERKIVKYEQTSNSERYEF